VCTQPTIKVIITDSLTKFKGSGVRQPV